MCSGLSSVYPAASTDDDVSMMLCPQEELRVGNRDINNTEI